MPRAARATARGAIDVDILMLGELELANERMTLPHEQLLARRFVLIPALELDFELATPSGETARGRARAAPARRGGALGGPPLELAD